MKTVISAITLLCLTVVPALFVIALHRTLRVEPDGAVPTTLDRERAIREAYAREVADMDRAAREGVEAGDRSLVRTLDADRRVAYERCKADVRAAYEGDGLAPPAWTVED